MGSFRSMEAALRSKANQVKALPSLFGCPAETITRILYCRAPLLPPARHFDFQTEPPSQGIRQYRHFLGLSIHQKSSKARSGHRLRRTKKLNDQHRDEERKRNGPSFDPCVNSYSSLKACPLLPQQRSDGGEFSLLRTQRPSEIRPKNGSLVGTR